MDYPVEVPLKRPITVDGTTYGKLLFDEPDLNAQIGYSEMEQTFADPPSSADAGRVVRFWVSRLADVPEAVAGKLKTADLAAVDAVLDSILSAKKPSGAAADLGNVTPAK